MNKLLLVIDVQRDFVNENTSKTVIDIKNLIETKRFDIIAFTKFINDKNSIWYNKLNYKGCITKEQQKIEIDTKNYKVFNKRTYTALNSELKMFIEEKNIDEIYLCGFDTDACVTKTALDMFEQDYNVYILSKYCMSHAGSGIHNVYIENMKRLIGKERIL